MPRVLLTGSACRQLAGGQSELQVEADSVRRLILELDRRFPGLGKVVKEGITIAIDGVIYQDTYSAALRPDSEVCLIPKIAGGSPAASAETGRIPTKGLQKNLLVAYRPPIRNEENAPCVSKIY